MDQETLHLAQSLKFKSSKLQNVVQSAQTGEIIANQNDELQAYNQNLHQLLAGLEQQEDNILSAQNLKQQLKASSQQIKSGYQILYDQITTFKTSFHELQNLKNYYASYLQLLEFLKPSKQDLIKSPSVIAEPLQTSKNILDTINSKYFFESVELLNFLLLTQKQQIKHQSLLQKTITSLLQTTSEIQEIHFNINQFAAKYIDAFFTKQFAYEIEYDQQLCQNTFAQDILLDEPSIKITPYQLVQHYLTKINGLLDIAYARDLNQMVLMLKNDDILNYSNFKMIYQLVNVIDSILTKYWHRYLIILKSQYDILFMSSDKYDKTKSLKTIDGCRQYFKFLMKYIQKFFDQLNLDEQFFSNQQQVAINLNTGIQPLLNQYNFSFYINDTFVVDQLVQAEKTVVQKIIDAGGLILKQSLTMITLSQKTSCKIGVIKQCFERQYKMFDNFYSKQMFQQLIIDMLVRLVYNFVSYFSETMGYKWQEIHDELLDELLISCEQAKGILKDIAVQIVYLVINMNVKHFSIDNQ